MILVLIRRVIHQFMLHFREVGSIAYLHAIPEKNLDR